MDDITGFCKTFAAEADIVSTLFFWILKNDLELRKHWTFFGFFSYNPPDIYKVGAIASELSENVANKMNLKKIHL